jgi:hypothetical protein
MTTERPLISAARIKRIKAQGYHSYSDGEISEFAFGNRFAYILCVSILIVGVAMASVPILISMGVVAFFGVVLPYHPFDYIYNYVLRGMMNKPKLPPRSKQLKFACTVATIWIAATVYFFYSGLTLAGYVAGALLSAIALSVSTIDLCIPSLIYNAISKPRT